MYLPSHFTQLFNCSKQFSNSVGKSVIEKRSKSELIERISKEAMINAYLAHTGLNKIGPVKRWAHISELKNHQDFLIPYGQLRIGKSTFRLEFDLFRYQNRKVILYYFNLDKKRQFPQIDRDLLGHEYSAWIMSRLIGIHQVLLVNHDLDMSTKLQKFYAEDITDRFKFHFHNKIKPSYLAARRLLRNSQSISYQFGAHCGLHTENECKFLHECHSVGKSNQLLSYQGVFSRHRYSLVSRKVETFEEVPVSIAYKKHEVIIQNQIGRSKDHIDRAAIRTWLKPEKVKKPENLYDLRIGKNITPLIFMDFEAYDFKYPIGANWEIDRKIPFQFSIQILYPGKTNLAEAEYLDVGEGVPHYEFITRLLEVTRGPLTKGARTLVYNKFFESGVLKGLQEQFPEKEQEIGVLIKSLLDLMTPFQRRYFYSGAQMGSYSLKDVYPAIRKYVPASHQVAPYTYSDLKVRSGLSAVIYYALLQSRYKIEPKDYHRKKIRNKIIENMREYCRLDTLSMYEILVALNEFAKE